MITETTSTRARHAGPTHGNCARTSFRMPLTRFPLITRGIVSHDLVEPRGVAPAAVPDHAIPCTCSKVNKLPLVSDRDADVVEPDTSRDVT
jgi:hypothetical protein